MDVRFLFDLKPSFLDGIRLKFGFEIADFR
jgi:hypothetical protein